MAGLWACVKCAAQGIAGTLRRCPQCHEECEDVPKTTTEGGGTNGAGVPAEPEADPVVVPDPATVPKSVLVGLADEVGVPASGTKAEIADALAAHPDTVTAAGAEVKAETAVKAEATVANPQRATAVRAPAGTDAGS